MREGICQSCIDSIIFDVLPFKGEMVSQKVRRETLYFPDSLDQSMLTKRRVLNTVILPTGVAK